MSHLDTETDNVGVMFAPADSDVMVISFAHMDFDIAGGTFWGQDAIHKSGYAGIGLICKANSWYPGQDIQQLSSYILERCRPYKAVALYGFSMGAYAAIKYGKLLQADCSIALSPQFSIDPADVFAHDQRLMHFFNPSLNEKMAISPADVGGTVYMFYDPYVAPDKWNFEMIHERAGPAADVRAITVPRIGHETIDVFAGTELLKDLVKFCLARDMAGLQRLTAQSRRRTQRRIFNTLHAVRQISPARAAALFDKHQEQLSAYWRQQWNAPL